MKVSEGALALGSAASAYSHSPISSKAEAAASFFLSTQLLGPTWTISPYLEEGVMIKKEVDKRKQTDSGGHPVNILICPNFSTQRFYILKSKKKKKKAKDFFTLIQRKK